MTHRVILPQGAQAPQIICLWTFRPPMGRLLVLIGKFCEGNEAPKGDWLKNLFSEFPLGRFTRAGKGPYPSLSQWADDEGEMVTWPFEISAEMQMFLTRFILGPIDIIFKWLSGVTPEGNAARKFEWSKNLLLLGKFNKGNLTA